MFQRYFLAPLAALLLLAAPHLTHAQTGAVGIGTTTPAASAALDITSTSKGLLPPRMTQAQRDAITSPATGLTIYNTTTNKLNTWNGTSWDASLSATEQAGLAGASVRFDHVRGPQTYTVPANVFSLQVDAVGSAGGGTSLDLAGAGARVQAKLAVSPGQVLTIYVGSAGDFNPGTGFFVGGYNGGGGAYLGGTGGGATDLRSGSGQLGDRLLVAGGGGGGGTSNSTNTSSHGGDGGAPNGGYGTSWSNSGNGGGATQMYSGGTGGVTSGDGDLGTGGKGEGATFGGGGGGGGGYYGGGGGYFAGRGAGNNYPSGGAGGGGSSWVTPTGSSAVIYTAGVNPGNGSLTITPGPAYAAPALNGANFINLPGWTISGSDVFRATGNVGIGTNSPGQKLDVIGNTNVNGNTNVSGNSYVSGRVGIGTTNPGHLLTVKASLSGDVLGFNANDGTDKYNWSLTNGGLNLSESNVAAGRLFVRDGGNVGIGTTSPTQTLDVNGGILARASGSISTQGAYLQWNRSGGGDGATWLLNQQGLGPGGIFFGKSDQSNNVTEWARFDSQGNLGIGTTSPIAKLHVSGSVQATPTGGNTSYFSGGSVLIGPQPPGGTTARPTAAYFDGGQVWVNSTIVAGALNTTSDRRIKHVIGLSDRAADLVLLNRLRITDYSYIDQHANTPGVVKKVIAQEVEQVLPTAVSRSTQAIPNVYEKATRVSFAHGLLTVTTAKSHELPATGGRLRFYTPANESLDVDVTVVDAHTVRFASAQAYASGLFVYGKYVDDFRSVDYDALTTLNVSATQELARQVAELKAENAALKANSESIKTELQTVKAQATATLEAFEARLRRLEAGTAQAQR